MATKQQAAKKAPAKKPTPKAQAHSMLAKPPEECADLVGKSIHWDANGTKVDGVIADVSDMPNHLHVRFWHAGAAAWEEDVTILSKDDFQRITPIAW